MYKMYIHLYEICLIPELQEAFQGSWQDQVINYPQKSQSSCALIFKCFIFKTLTTCVMYNVSNDIMIDMTKVQSSDVHM